MKSDINDLCEAFLAALTNAGYAVKSIENYKQVSNRFKKFCAENGYDTYTVNIGQIFADNVFNEETGAFVGYRNVMYGRFVRLINSFYLQGTFDFSMVTKEKNLPKSIHLISAYDMNTQKHRRNRMILILLYDTGARVQELADLDIESLHLDVPNPYISIIGKGRKRRNVPIMRKTVAHLNSYLKEFHPSEQSAPLFYSMRDGKPHRLSTDSISLVVGTAAKMARETCNAVPENVHCHLFRKTKAMDLYKNGIPLPFIMQLLGHESMSTTSGFYAFATLEMMSDAINKSVPTC